MDDLRVVRGLAAEQIVDVGQRDAEITRIEVVLVHVAATDLPQPAVPGRGQFVQAVVAAEHQGCRPTRAEHARDQRDAVQVRDADGVGLGARRLHSGPRKLNTVGTPSSARVGPA